MVLLHKSDPFLLVIVGQLISAGSDKKILFWDTRMAKAIEYLRNLGAEVDSMSLSGFNLMVATGASVYMYDLRNLDNPVQSKESHLDLRIRCVSSIPYSKGIIKVISFLCCKQCSYCGW
jgi:cell cycle arrest protein BUB3